MFFKEISWLHYVTNTDGIKLQKSVSYYFIFLIITERTGFYDILMKGCINTYSIILEKKN